MKEPIELTPEDVARIEQQAQIHTRFNHDFVGGAEYRGYQAGAEYATKYEREDSTKLYVEFYNSTVVALSERIKELEAELHALNEAVKHGI